ncbi:CDP-alcohol phosphatidyltransferase family protein [Pollutibacter soli]|uniref:CDP-alcohol phosphatidyltransferase family protein n=1 Tax=Pollutibacter soli TaxID=3034157 RepID=UPI0030138636
MKQIPNLFTLLNLIAGCLAIVFILQTGEGIINYNGQDWKIYLPEKIWWGSVCIGIAGIIDFLDGFVARLFKSTSEMGKQLDSLADVVSFGVAPGMIMYQLLRISFASTEDGLDVAMFSLIPAFLVPAAAAWRLARFNISEPNLSGFTGIPAPAAGLLIASFPLILLYNYFNVQQLLLNRWVLYLLIFVISYLMVSRLPMISMKFSGGGAKGNLPKIILVVVAVLAAITLKWLAVPVVFLAYILISLIYKKQTA